MTHTATVDAVVTTLAAAGTHTADRLTPALQAAQRRVRAELPAAVAEAAWADLLAGLQAAGASALDGGDPQRVEDAVYAAQPDSRLPEFVLRQAWLALLDELGKTGDKPPFGGSGGAEAWAFTARSRPWAFADLAGAVDTIVGRFGQGVQVVCVRGPGRSTVLAAARRALLGAHGADAFVPPVLVSARDALGEVLEPMLHRSPLEAKLKEALPNLRFGEDRVGLLGRVGDSVPVALLLDDAHIQSRSVMLGLPLFMEPAPDRNALLVVAAPSDPGDDSALTELLADARSREILTEITLPALDAKGADALWAAAFGDAAGHGAALAAACETTGRPALALGLAQAWLTALIGDDGAPAADAGAQLSAGYAADGQLPALAEATAILSRAALEGHSFHGFAVGTLMGLSEDDVEDLLHDDEFELEGQVVGGCDGAVPTERTLWADLPDGLHPVFRFTDARLAEALRQRLSPEGAAEAAGGLRDALMSQYQPQAIWQVADRVWYLDRASQRPRMVEQLLLGTGNPQRVEAGFRRMLPVLGAKTPYRLALARLFGTAMEMGQVAGATGKVQLADQAFQAAAAAGQRLGRTVAAAEALGRLGEVRLALALPTEARQAFNLAEQLLADGKQPRTLARISLLQGEAAVLEGDIDGALETLQAAVATLREVKDEGHVALGGLRVGRLHFEKGDHAQAVAVLDEAIRLADAAGDPRPAAAARMTRAFVHGELGELDQAMHRLREAAAAFQSVRMPAHIVEVAAAGIQRRAGQPAEAEQRLRPMADAFKKAQAAVQWADAWQEVGRCALDQQRFTEAVDIFKEVLDIRARARDRFALLRLHEDRARAYAGQGDATAAVADLARARRFAERMGLARHLGRLDGALVEFSARLDALPDGDSQATRATASAEVDALEARWTQPAQPQTAEPGTQVH